MGQAAERYDLNYDLGYTHIVQLKKGNMKRLLACKPNQIDKCDFNNKKDIYYTPNSFNSPLKRERNNLWQLNELYIDIDHVEGTAPIEKFEVVPEIEKLVDDGKIPKPSRYVNSGRGIHVYWDIRNCHVMLLDLWQRLEDYLYSSVKEIEKNINNIKVDKLATDPTRLLRLTGTINSKNNELCYTMLDNNIVYDIFELKKDYIKPKKGSYKNKKVVTFSKRNLYTLNMFRVEDLKTLVSLREGDVEGYRNALIMFYSYFYRLENDITLEELIKVTREFNNSFKLPYSVGELKAVCRSINRTVKVYLQDGGKFYKFSNKYIIEKLDITLEEQGKLKTIISKEEKNNRDKRRKKLNRRDSDGLTKRTQQKNETIQKVQELKEQGYKQKEISEELNISKGWVSQIIKKLNMK